MTVLFNGTETEPFTCDCRLWNSITGKEGVGKANSNGILLLSKCSEHNLVITNTLFRQRNMYKTTWNMYKTTCNMYKMTWNMYKTTWNMYKTTWNMYKTTWNMYKTTWNMYKTTWMHPRSKHWHLLDFITILRLLHDNMTATVLFNGTETEPFTTRTGFKQGCVIAPTLFTFYLCAILFLVRDRLPHGVELDCRLDGRLFNLSRIKAKTKAMKTAVIDIQYADNCAIFAHSAEELQTSLDLLTENYQSLGLSNNIKKTKVIHQPTPGINAGPPEIKVSGGSC